MTGWVFENKVELEYRINNKQKRKIQESKEQSKTFSDNIYEWQRQSQGRQNWWYFIQSFALLFENHSRKKGAKTCIWKSAK